MKTPAIFFLLPVALLAQGLTQSALLHPSPDSWPTYNGDYTGKRYSSLAQVNRQTVKNLSLAWMSQPSVPWPSSAAGADSVGPSHAEDRLT